MKLHSILNNCGSFYPSVYEFNEIDKFPMQAGLGNLRNRYKNLCYKYASL
mgnify:CR=1 FL=1